ncbi:MAG TPA: hypothetical protein VHD91_10425 [Gaiellaceae bacterium]|nr:hypothetical protein [Gaiellaceae bacterium]
MREPALVDDRDLDERSRRIGQRVDALDHALRAAGVAPEQAARLLETAATAALNALTLELLLDPLPAAATPVATVEELPAAEPGDVAEAA